MKIHNLPPYIFLLALFFSSCHSHGDHAHEHLGSAGEHSHEQEEMNTTTLTPAQIKSINVEFGQLEKKQLTTSLKANGILKVPNQNRASATAMLGGVVRSILVQTGDPVRQGQVVATIANPSFLKLQEEYFNALAEWTLSEQELARQKEMAAGNATAMKNLQTAEAQAQSWKVKKASLEKQLDLLGIKVSEVSAERLQTDVRVLSPISGAIADVRVNIGTYVEALMPIVEIVDNSQLHLDLYVYEADLPKLSVGQTVHFTLTNNPGREYDADIYSISNTFESASKAVAVHAKVKGNKQGLIDGMSVTGLISLEKASVEAVPSEAIVHHDGLDFIFIVRETGADSTVTFEKIPVRQGTTEIGYSEITLLKTIQPQTQIVTKGAFFIMAKITNQGEAHAH